MATTVPHRGGRGGFAVDKCWDFIIENGDPQNNILEAPRKDKRSHGIVERAVRELEGHVRAILLSLEQRLGVEVDAKERIVAVIPAYAADLYDRLHRGDDGKVPYERVKGKKPT
eukprot:8434851-Karenia_brevis.AAC.1